MTSRHVFVASLGALLAFVAGCAKDAYTPPAPPGGPGAGMRGPVCPTEIRGTDMALEETPGGIAMVFTTEDKDRVEDVRRSARELMSAHNRHAMGMRHGGPDHRMGGRGSHMIRSQANVEDLRDGARVVLTPDDPTELMALRAMVADHARRMESGECPMMDAAAPPDRAPPVEPREPEAPEVPEPYQVPKQ